MADPRPIRLPPADFSSRPLPVKILKSWKALRVHGIPWPAAQFRLVPSHRFSHPDAPGGLLYAGGNLETCLWECFGDSILDPVPLISRARWMNQRVSRIRYPGSLRVCDLTDVKVRAALKVDLSALAHTDLDVPQAWGLALQTHPADLDGLLYLSRFTGKRCVVLFERPSLAAGLRSKMESDLADLDAANRFLSDQNIALV